MATPQEEDFPKGHPKRFDYDPDSPEALEWMRKNYHPKGERDYPLDHPKAVDTPGNTNAREVLPGIDPDKPELEAFTGRTPEVAKRVQDITRKLSEHAKETVLPEPTIAPNPPAPGSTAEPTGQPDTVLTRLMRRTG